MTLPVPLRIGLGLAAVVCSSATFAADALMVASPDNKLRLAFAVEGGGLVYSVRFNDNRSEEHTSELQSLAYLVCRLLLEKKKKTVRHNLKIIDYEYFELLSRISN